ncbi:MAG: ATP:cob(I)alamin adenosyltransferase [Bacteroidetes bacterium CG2_30_33_31]|nr:MAG: ATP:cob(I)alamin adenosyltransferase [Bacteroidetes bacterium CG2_30_33_31]
MKNKFKIYTKAGDKGETSLIGGRRVNKSDLQVEAYGTIDELKSHIALLSDMIKAEDINENLKKIIIHLFEAESVVACATIEAVSKMPKLSEEDVLWLEKNIDMMDEKLPPLTAFILPGGDASYSQSHIARTVCRRAERACLRFWEVNKTLYNPTVEKYLNRLSDYLFTLSRYILNYKGIKENLWQSKEK